MKTQRKPSDLGVVEQDRHFQARLEPVSPQNPSPRRRVLTQRVVDRLLLDERITPDQWSAAQRLWRMAYNAGFSGNLESHLRKLQVIDTTPESYTDKWDAASELSKLLADFGKKFGQRKTHMLKLVVIEDMAVTVAARASRLSAGRGVGYMREMLEGLVDLFSRRGA